MPVTALFERGRGRWGILAGQPEFMPLHPTLLLLPNPVRQGIAANEARRVGYRGTPADSSRCLMKCTSGARKWFP